MIKNKDKLVILDIEVNTKENVKMNEHFHVIQIGAVKKDFGADKQDLFNAYVKPKDVFEYPNGGPILTPFIKELTKITQEQVDGAEPFEVVWPKFLKFCSPYFECFASWGAYDWEVLQRSCEYYKLKFPFKYHINLKEYYRLYYNKGEWKPGTGVQKALNYFGLEPALAAHNALNDAVMITAVASKMVETGFYTFTKKRYGASLTSCKDGKWLWNPVIVKKYKELSEWRANIEGVLFK